MTTMASATAERPIQKRSMCLHDPVFYKIRGYCTALASFVSTRRSTWGTTSVPARKLTRYRATDRDSWDRDLERRFFTGSDAAQVERNILGGNERAVAVEQRDDGRPTLQLMPLAGLRTADRQSTRLARVAEGHQLERLARST